MVILNCILLSFVFSIRLWLLMFEYLSFFFFSDCTDFSTFTKPFYHPYTQCKEIKQYEETYILIIIHNKKGLLRSAGLDIWSNMECLMARMIKVPFDSDPLNRISSTSGDWTQSMRAVIYTEPFL